MRVFGTNTLSLSLLATLAATPVQSETRVVYLTAYTDQNTQIAEALSSQGKLSRYSDGGAVFWLEKATPTPPGGHSDEPNLEDIARLDAISEADWSQVAAVARKTFAPVRVLFRDGVEFTARIDRGELVVVQSASEISRGVIDQRFQEFFKDGAAVAIPTGPFVGGFTGDPNEVAMQSIGEPILTKPDGLSSTTVDCGPEDGQEKTHCALYAVRLISAQRGTICTGTLVSDRHILTAAHCVCDEVTNGTLSPQITASVGIPGRWSALDLEPEGVHFFEGTGSGVCPGSGLLFEDRRDRGDLSIMTIAEGSLDEAVARLTSLGVAPDTAERIRAPLPGPQTGPEIWGSAGPAANVFVTFGFGVGPDGQAGIKRAMKYTFRHLDDCRYEETAGAAGCGGVQEAIFRDESAGLCAGDSGSGVFKWADGSRDGFGKWVLMGVVAGYINPANCHDTDTGLLLEEQHARNIVRIDTGLVKAWIDNIVDTDTVFETTALLSPPLTVAGDGN